MDSNPVLILTHNCLALTKKCVESVRAQDISTVIHIIDNDSTDGTWEWVENENFAAHCLYRPQIGVSAGWNHGLTDAFLYFEHVLVLNNDTILPPWFYRSLLAYNEPFVTGASVREMDSISEPQPRKELAPCPDFSAFLIRREAWEKIGPFDENFVHYCGDMDYHIRAHRVGIRLWNSGVHFYHERSSTLKNAMPEERRAIQIQADSDRAIFKQKWRVGANDPAYANLFSEETFGIDAK